MGVLARWLCVLALWPSSVCAQDSIIQVVGDLSFFNAYTNLKTVKAVLGDPERGGLTPYHASFAGGGSGRGYIGYYSFRRKAILLQVSQHISVDTPTLEDEYITVRTATFKGKRSGLRLSGDIGFGSPRSDVKRAFGEPGNRGQYHGGGSWYQGSPRLFQLRFNIFGRLKKVIIH